MSARSMFFKEISAKKRHMRLSNHKLTRRAQPPHSINGFIQDSREKYKIAKRMFPANEE
jgi:hypothetical protein